MSNVKIEDNDLRNDTGSDIRPCAVSKVDLKGRLVFVDAEVESLIGYSQDELFGRPLKEFVGEQYHDILDRLLVLHSHYETFFETTQLELLNRDEEAVPVAVIVSLNFVAGNPVNFQVIFNPIATAEPDTRQRANHDAWEKTTRLIAHSDALWDWKAHVQTLKEIANCQEIIVYRIDNEVKLILEATSADPGGGETPISLAGEPSDLHRWIARNRMEYSFVDNADIQSAMSIIRTPPNEYCSVVSDRKEHLFLIRAAYGEVDSIQSVRNGIDRLRMVLHALQHSAQARVKRADTDLNAENAVINAGDALDTVGAAYCRIGPDGAVTSINETLADMVGRPTHVNALLEELLADNHQFQADWISKSIERRDSVNIPIVTIGGHSARLQLMTSGDHYQTMIVTRGTVVGSNVATARVLKDIQQLSSTASDLADSLPDGDQKSSKNTPPAILGSLRGSLRRLDAYASLLLETSALVDPGDRPVSTDLGKAFTSIHEQISSNCPDTNLDLSFGDLATVRVRRASLIRLLERLISLMISGQSAGKVKIAVTTSIEEQVLSMRLTTRSNEDLPPILRLLGDANSAKKRARYPAHDIDCLTIELLAERLGAEIRVDDTDDKDITVELTIPVLT